MIQCCLFDMGNVLVFFSHERMCAQIGRLCGRTEAEINRLLIDSGLQWDFERGRLSPSTFHERLQEQVDRPLDFDDLRQAASDIFSVNDAVRPVLDNLKRQGMRLVLFSNTSQFHFDFIRQRFDILDAFDDFVLSYQTGFIKPEQPIYDVAIEVAGYNPDECFYTDDRDENIDQGRIAGLQAELFIDEKTLIRDLRKHGVPIDCSREPLARTKAH